MMEPITNLCVVADIYRCPPKYELVIITLLQLSTICFIPIEKVMVT